jgi:hypothetical protein
MATVADSIIDTQVENTAIMLKLRDRQPPQERQAFAHCSEPDTP